jgi:hypothetical protein
MNIVTNPTKANEMEIRKVDGDALVHDPAHDKVHVLNGTAANILEMCDGTRSSTDIARALCDVTGADFSVVSCDVAAILDEFVALQLVVNR